MKYSRRRVWLATFIMGLLTAGVWQVYDMGTVQIVLYNDSDHLFPGVNLNVGGQNCEAGALAVRESLTRRFRRAGKVMDFQMYIDSEPPLRWAGPGLLQGKTGRLTLRVDEAGHVTVTPETTFLAGLLDFLD